MAGRLELLESPSCSAGMADGQKVESIANGQGLEQSCLRNEAYTKTQRGRVWRDSWLVEIQKERHVQRAWDHHTLRHSLPSVFLEFTPFIIHQKF